MQSKLTGAGVIVTILCLLVLAEATMLYDAHFHQGLPTLGEDFEAVMSLPPGGLYISHRTDSVWRKMQLSNGELVLSFVRVPKPSEARIVDRFSPGAMAPTPSMTTTTTTTTTTLPLKQKSKKG